MVWFGRFDPKAVIARNAAEATVFMGVPTLYVRMLAEPTLTREAVRRHAAVHQRLGPAAGGNLRQLDPNAPAMCSWNATA